MYTISEKFHESLCRGMPKNDALQKAKIHFKKYGHMEKPAPYYWAIKILVRDQQPIQPSGNHHVWWWIGGAVLIAAILLVGNH